MAEEARLESVYTSKAYPGFESPSLRLQLMAGSYPPFVLNHTDRKEPSHTSQAVHSPADSPYKRINILLEIGRICVTYWFCLTYGDFSQSCKNVKLEFGVWSLPCSKKPYTFMEPCLGKQVMPLGFYSILLFFSVFFSLFY